MTKCKAETLKGEPCKNSCETFSSKDGFCWKHAQMIAEGKTVKIAKIMAENSTQTTFDLEQSCDLEDTISKEQIEIQHLKKLLLSGRQEANDGIESLQAEVARLTRENASVVQELQEQKGGAGIKQVAYDFQATQYAEVCEEKKKLQTTVLSMRSEIEQLRTKSIGSVQSESELQSAKTRSDAENDRLTGELQSAETQLAELQSAKTRSDAENDRLARELQSVETQLAELQSAKTRSDAENDRLARELQSAKTQLGENDRLARELQSAKTRSDAENDRLARELQSSHNRLIRQAQEKINELQQANQDYRGELQACRHEAQLRISGLEAELAACKDANRSMYIEGAKIAAANQSMLIEGTSLMNENNFLTGAIQGLQSAPRVINVDNRQVHMHGHEQISYPATQYQIEQPPPLSETPLLEAEPMETDPICGVDMPERKRGNMVIPARKCDRPARACQYHSK